VDVEQAGDQPDPTNASPVRFTVTFSEPVSGFDKSSVSLGSGTPSFVLGVTGGPQVYVVEVGVSGAGIVEPTIPAHVAQDAAGNWNASSTSTDAAVVSTVPTLTADKSDYAPGTQVVISGDHWAPNAPVTIMVHRDPQYVDDVVWTTSADDVGRFVDYSL